MYCAECAVLTSAHPPSPALLPEARARRELRPPCALPSAEDAMCLPNVLAQG